MSLLYVIVALVFFASILIARKAKKKTMNPWTTETSYNWQLAPIRLAASSFINKII